MLNCACRSPKPTESFAHANGKLPSINGIQINAPSGGISSYSIVYVGCFSNIFQI